MIVQTIMISRVLWVEMPAVGWKDMMGVGQKKPWRKGVVDPTSRIFRSQYYKNDCECVFLTKNGQKQK